MPFKCIILDIDIIYNYEECYINALDAVKRFLKENHNIHNTFDIIYNDFYKKDSDLLYDEKNKIRHIGDKLKLSPNSIFYMLKIFDETYFNSIIVDEKILTLMRTLSDKFIDICIMSNKEYNESLKILERTNLISCVSYLDTSYDRRISRYDKQFIELFIYSYN